MKHAGTITWIDAKLQTPPIDIKVDGMEWSYYILLYNNEIGILSRGFYLYAIERFVPDNGNWQPTHWAYINYPK